MPITDFLMSDALQFMYFFDNINFSKRMKDIFISLDKNPKPTLAQNPPKMSTLFLEVELSKIILTGNRWRSCNLHRPFQLSRDLCIVLNFLAPLISCSGDVNPGFSHLVQYI